MSAPVSKDLRAKYGVRAFSLIDRVFFYESNCSADSISSHSSW